MDIFLSWSGEKSKKTAAFLEEWLQLVLQTTDPWMSSGIDRGAVWFSAIYEKLAVTKIGIICLTKENLEKPWILFEAGALARGLLSQRVCPLLIDLGKSDVGPPLSQLNLTDCTRDDVYRLVLTINNLLTTPLKNRSLDRVFEKYWDEFDAAISKIKAMPDATNVVVTDDFRKSDAKLDELLGMVRAIQMGAQTPMSSRHRDANERYFDRRSAKTESELESLFGDSAFFSSALALEIRNEWSRLQRKNLSTQEQFEALRLRFPDVRQEWLTQVVLGNESR